MVSRRPPRGSLILTEIIRAKLKLKNCLSWTGEEKGWNGSREGRGERDQEVRSTAGRLRVTPAQPSSHAASSNVLLRLVAENLLNFEHVAVRAAIENAITTPATSTRVSDVKTNAVKVTAQRRRGRAGLTYRQRCII